MADEKKPGKIGGVDKIFERFGDWVSEKIAGFVAFLFILFGAGAVYGAVMMAKLPQYTVYFLAVPFVLAAVAYYNRGVAAVLFIALLLVFVL